MQEFKKIFENFKSLLVPYSSELILRTDDSNNYYLDTHHVMSNKKHLFFGSAKIGKRYVAYHLMPVYVNPELLQDITPNLKKRMQGKSCFNLVQYDSELIAELDVLTRRGYEDYKSKGYIEN